VTIYPIRPLSLTSYFSHTPPPLFTAVPLHTIKILRVSAVMWAKGSVQQRNWRKSSPSCKLHIPGQWNSCRTS